MPDDKLPNPNGKTPKHSMPEEMHFARRPVICPQCKRKFGNYMIVEVDDLKQLECNDVLVINAELACMHCGWLFYWHVKTNIKSDMSNMALTFGELISKIDKYNPE